MALSIFPACLFSLLLLLPDSAVSFSVETRRSTLYSNDGDEIIGSLLERKSPEGVHEVFVGGMDEIEKGSALQISLPYFETADSVGSSLWPSSVAGSILLRCSELKTFTEDTDILELGSGLGLGGLVAGKTATRCVLTDNDEELVDRLRQHVLDNQDSLGDKISVQQLDWRDSDPSQQPTEEEKFDSCFGFDVAYYFHLVVPLINTIRQKLRGKNSILCVLGQANRESQWQLYHHIRDGGYNQLIDEHEAPWEGNTSMLLYKLEVGVWTDGEDKDGKPGAIDGTLPIAALLYTTPGGTALSLTPHDHIATEEDEKSQMKTF